MPERLHTNVFCPTCGDEVIVTVGGRADRLMNAIELQARRVGVEFQCGHCGCVFIYRICSRSPRVPEIPAARFESWRAARVSAN
jgi:predicted RNA-binding Zn-ribbon protein involved in translation (DUF1610 family)